MIASEIVGVAIISFVSTGLSTRRSGKGPLSIRMSNFPGWAVNVSRLPSRRTSSENRHGFRLSGKADELIVLVEAGPLLLTQASPACAFARLTLSAPDDLRNGD